MSSTENPNGWSNPLKDLDHWWFGKGSPVALGLFRVVLGLVTFASLALTAIDFEAWYTERGFLPVGAAEGWVQMDAKFAIGPNFTVQLPMEHFPRINLLGGITDSRIALAFYLIVMLAALTTTVGIWTRLSTAVLAIGLISIHHRNPVILHSGDTLMRLCAIYIAWAPSGRACSLDRVIRLWKGKEGPVHNPISLWGQRLIQYQVALVYFTTVWWKWFGIYWKDGTATWYPENLNEFNRFPAPSLMRHQPFLAFTTYGTLVVELALATLIFYKPLRKYVLLAGIAMHGFIEYHFNIPFFAFAIVSAYICFYESEEIVAWTQRLGERVRRWRLLVDLPKGLQLKPNAEAALKAMDPLSLVSFDSGAGEEWTALTLTGRRRNAFVGSFLRCLGAWSCLCPWIWKRVLRSATEPEESTPNTKKGKVAGLASS